MAVNCCLVRLLPKDSVNKLMNKALTLKGRRQYLVVYERGKRWWDKLVVMRALANGLDVSRFGFSVGKEVGKAVIRNRVRRWLREIARKAKVSPGWDIVFIARREAGEADYHQLKGTVEKLLARAKLGGRDETVSVEVD